MASRLYEETMNSGMNGQFNSFMQNPLQFLLQRRINVPPEYMNNPEQAVQYLLSSGQMSQAQLNQLRAKAAMMGINV